MEMHYNVYQLLMLFLVYSFLGWCVEVSFVAVTTGRVVNRGFLNGPVCPIYGVGMLGALLLLEPVSDNLVLLFFLGMLLCTLVELIGGWILERAFHTRWWDYTDKPFNLGGYVCLGFSIMWGFAVTFAVRLIHPLVFSLACWLPHLVGWILIGVLYALFLIDFVLTLITVIGLRKQLGELERVGQALHTVGDTISDRLGNSALAADAKLESAKLAGQERVAEGKEKLETAMENSQKKLAESKERLSESKEKLGDKISESLQELQQKKQRLEMRQKELASSLGEGARFGTRRLTGAFPGLREEIRRRLEESKKNTDAQ
jgi:uncharacterized membrane protein